MNNTCHFGPDIRGEFIVEVVSSERADSCDRHFCVCDTHDFEPPDTFESVLAARQAAAYDRTKKPHEEGEESEDNTTPVNIDTIPIDPTLPIFNPETPIITPGTEPTVPTDVPTITTVNDGPDKLVWILIPLMVILAIIFIIVACILYRKNRKNREQ